jgi:HEAT repeat protein
MSLFDLFRKSDKSSPSGERELSRLAKSLGSKLSQDPDRYDAIERLGSIATKDSARILLGRFRWSLDPSIRDQEEKSLALEGIARAGREALEPIRDYCARAESLLWPIKALREILPQEELGTELLNLLEAYDTEYLRNPEPKVQLIQALEEFRSEETRLRVEPFVGDVSEAVRFAAVTCLFSVGRAESLESLLGALVEEESLRIKNRTATGLAERRWEIPEAWLSRVSQALPPGFLLKGRVVSGSPAGQ